MTSACIMETYSGKLAFFDSECELLHLYSYNADRGTEINGLPLTHWGRVIIWTNAGILVIGPRGTNFSEILIGIQTFSFKKMHLKMSSAKWRPFCLGLNVLNYGYLQK